MIPNNVWLREAWLSYRKHSLLRCVERYRIIWARELHCVLRKMQEVEEMMAQVEPETGGRLPNDQPVAGAAPAESELLNRRLAAANAEIRRYQTRLFAFEREMVALRQENAELEALCEQARKNSLLPPKKPQPKVLDQPGLPVIVFHPEEVSEKRPTAAEEPMEAVSAPCSAEPDYGRFEQPDWKPRTQLDRLSMEIVQRLENLMK